MPHTVVFSSDLCRFLSYGENREIVKDVLLDLGLKKVKLGIEAYVDPQQWPTSITRADAPAVSYLGHTLHRFPLDTIVDEPVRSASAEDVYRYEQRPYIALSWEKVRRPKPARARIASAALKAFLCYA